MNYNLIKPKLIAENSMLKLYKQIDDLTDGMCQVGAGPYGFGTANHHHAPIGIIIVSDPPMVKNKTILPDDVSDYKIEVKCYSEAFDCVLNPEDVERYSNSADVDTLKILNAWCTLRDSIQFISTADCYEAFNVLGDLEYRQYELSLYCPVQICRFPNMTCREAENIDDVYEDHVLDAYEVKPSNDVKELLCKNIEFQDIFDIIGCDLTDTDEYRDAWQIVDRACVDIINNNGIWLKMDCRLFDEDDTERMRTFFADCLQEYNAQPWLFENDGDAYMAIPRPYEYYNQTNCAAPPSERNALLTEDELQEQLETTEDQGMGGIT
jgi:hypothetical protein